jgi:nitroreductase/NAD-dependent dihydropyrimidine dehydrogenase PreA subunit
VADIVVNQEACTQCGACIDLCTGHVFEQDNAQVRAIRPDDCWLCGHCVAVCPTDAIQHSDYPLDQCPVVDRSALPDMDGMVAAFRERRSARVFRDKPVPRELVRDLVDAARWVPSGDNAQPVDWLAFDDPAFLAGLSDQAVAVLAQTARLLRNPLLRPALLLALGGDQVRKGLESAPVFERLAQRHARGEDPIFRRAPVVLVAHVPIDDYFGRDHTVYAAYNLMLAAQRLGLGTCQIGYFTIALDRSRSLRDKLGLPKGRKPEVTLTLGYPRYRFRRALSRRQPQLIWGEARP